jgi:signal transduction histidine kinase
MRGLFDEGDVDDPEPTPTGNDLRVELDRRDLPRHLALFYRSPTDQFDSVASYLSYGLRNGHRCLYLADVNTPTQIEEVLRAVGVDVDARTAAGDLVIRDASDVYLEDGFDPDNTIETLREESRRSVAEGYEGLWLAGENSWCFHTEMSFDSIVEFEAEFDAACPDLPVTALCQYDLRKFSEESAAKALWTHRQIIYRGTICENPFYIPPDEFRSASESHLNAQLMLEQAYNLTEAHRELDKREQRLEVLNRVLRHNIRNDLNVVEGVLQTIDESEDLSAASRVQLDAAWDHVDAVVRMAEKARHVQQTISDPVVEAMDLGPVVDRAIENVRNRYPKAQVDVSVDRMPTVLADTNLDVAVEEALVNGIVHQETDQPNVSLTVSTPAADIVRITVRNPGSIPKEEIQTLQRGEETQLQHGSGLGLWLMTWIVENGRGAIRFPETEEGYAEIQVELSRASH